jgi:2'-5' RNA ligase
MEPEHPKKQRLFIALYPQTSVCKQLYRLTKDLVTATGGRAVPEPNLHLTLRFLGALDKSEQACIVEKLDRIQGQSFTLRFAAVEHRKRQQMLWAIVADTPRALSGLAEEIERSSIECGFPASDHAFKPHMTLARKVRKTVRQQEIGSLETRIDEFCLVRSETLPQGSQYTILKTWALGGPNDDK